MYIFSLLLVLCLFAFRNRKSHKVFKESKCAFFGSFFTAFTFLVVAVFNILVDTTEYIITIQSTAILIALIVIWALFYGARMYHWAVKPDLRDELTITAEPSRTKETFTTSPPSPLPVRTKSPNTTQSDSADYGDGPDDRGITIRGTPDQDTIRSEHPPVVHQTSVTASQEIEMHAE